MAGLTAGATSVSAAPVVADPYTVILDRFDTASVGQGVYGVGFQAGMSGYGAAGSFSSGSYVRYALPPSASWNQLAGTVELWLKPQTHGFHLDFNWNNTLTAPPAGHVLELWDGTISGHLEIANWNFEYHLMLDSSVATQLGVWNHVAASWGPAGTRLYLNGRVIASSPSNLYPAGGVFAYLNGWGTTGFAGLIDDFHISSIQRTDAEILAHAAFPPGSAVQWAGNGHWYRAVQASMGDKLGVRWNQAAQAAAAAGGHLATITSAEENAFLLRLAWDSNLFPAGVGLWMGGAQLSGASEPASGWAWVTSENWSYTAWAAGQPDNAGSTGDEDHLTLRTGTGLWNDLNGDKYLHGFIIEFDALPPPGPAVSRFEAGPEGWATCGDAKLLQHQAPSPTRRGCIYAEDRVEGMGSAFLAPVQFLGNKRGAYGGALSFELRPTYTVNLAGNWDVVISGAGKTLFLDLPAPQIDLWNPRVAVLNENAGWRVSAPMGVPATREDLLDVLSDLTAIIISAEFHDGADRTGLDDVVLSIPCDFDRDADVDSDDLAVMQACAQGPSVPPQPGCEGGDLDRDGDVDQSDFGLFQRCLTGRNRPVDFDCAE